MSDKERPGCRKRHKWDVWFTFSPPLGSRVHGECSRCGDKFTGVRDDEH